MVSFLGRTDVREVRCRVTDTHTHTHTDPTAVTLAAHARRGLISMYFVPTGREGASCRLRASRVRWDCGGDTTTYWEALSWGCGLTWRGSWADTAATTTGCRLPESRPHGRDLSVSLSQLVGIVLFCERKRSAYSIGFTGLPRDTQCVAVVFRFNYHAYIVLEA